MKNKKTKPSINDLYTWPFSNHIDVKGFAPVLGDKEMPAKSLRQAINVIMCTDRKVVWLETQKLKLTQIIMPLSDVEKTTRLEF